MNIGGFCKRTGTCFGAKGLKQRHGKNRWRGGHTGIQWKRQNGEMKVWIGQRDGNGGKQVQNLT